MPCKCRPTAGSTPVEKVVDLGAEFGGRRRLGRSILRLASGNALAHDRRPGISLAVEPAVELVGARPKEKVPATHQPASQPASHSNAGSRQAEAAVAN